MKSIPLGTDAKPVRPEFQPPMIVVAAMERAAGTLEQRNHRKNAVIDSVLIGGPDVGGRMIRRRAAVGFEKCVDAQNALVGKRLGVAARGSGGNDFRGHDAGEAQQILAGFCHTNTRRSEPLEAIGGPRS